MKALAALLAFLVAAAPRRAARRTRTSDSRNGSRTTSASTADGLTIHGTYRHQKDAAPGPAALLISESGNTDRNGDNIVVGTIGNMRQLAELLSDRGDSQPALRQGRHRQDRPRPVPAAPQRGRQRRLHLRRQGRRPLPRRPVGHRQGSASRCTRWGRAPCMRWRWRRHLARRAEDPLAGPAPAAVRPLPRHHHQPGALRRQPRDAEHLAGRRRRGPHQGHRAQGAARGPRRDPQPRQRRRPSWRPTRSTRWRWPQASPRACRCC